MYSVNYSIYHIYVVTKLSLPNCQFMYLPSCRYQIFTLPNYHYQIDITKLSLLCCDQTVITKLLVPNFITKLSLLWTYQIVFTKFSSYQIVITEYSLPNCHHQMDIRDLRLERFVLWMLTCIHLLGLIPRPRRIFSECPGMISCVVQTLNK